MFSDMMSESLLFSVLLATLANSSIQCSYTLPEWIPKGEPLIQSCFRYKKSSNTPIEFSINLDIDTYINDVNNNFPSILSDGKWDLLDADTNEVVYECCGHETILNIPEKAKQLTTLKNFIINFFLDSLLPPHPQQKRYALHYYFVDEASRQEVLKAGTTDNMCDKNEYFFNVPCNIWDKCQLLPQNLDVVPPNYINKNAILPGMGNHLINPSFAPFGSEMTLVIGTFDQILNFFVPSISIAFFKEFVERYSGSSKGCEECYALELNQNQVFSFEGYYPTTLCLRLKKSENMMKVVFNDYKYFLSVSSSSSSSSS